jgi:hypothetical protein
MSLLKIVIISSLLALCGCKSTFVGRVQLDQTLKVKTKKHALSIAPGNYESTVKFSSLKQEAQWRIQLAPDQEVVIPLRIAKGSLPQDNARFSLKAQDTGQGFDLEGSLEMNFSDSAVYQATEYCLYKSSENVCNVDSKGQKFCKNEIVEKMGRRRYSYLTRSYVREVTAEIISAKTRAQLGKIEGTNKFSEIMKFQIGKCVFDSRAYSELTDYLNAVKYLDR